MYGHKDTTGRLDQKCTGSLSCVQLERPSLVSDHESHYISPNRHSTTDGPHIAPNEYRSASPQPTIPRTCLSFFINLKVTMCFVASNVRRMIITKSAISPRMFIFHSGLKS
ncbi:hypothetical protein BDR05DRAFT_302035 [Suillus weaverae]|nr:hypothetical protein BDR05DRAFT_302035 [Suillus weaverae]